MKAFRKIIWLVIAINLLIILYVLCTFKVEDMTLADGVVYDFNENWTIRYEDGTVEDNITLPYMGESERYETVIMENTIPDRYWGLTLSFLSADQEFRVYVDDKCIYEFGMNDERGFGKTPGSVQNFIDIPRNLMKGKIRIEIVSPYKNFASSIGTMTLAERDISILNLIKENVGSIAFSLMIFVSGFLFIVLAVVQQVTKQPHNGLTFLSVYCLDACVYYSIETKVLTVLYGNQTIYSILIFMSLMVMPFALLLYYGRSLHERYTRKFEILLGIVCFNIVAQLSLQLSNTIDFMDMVFVSHILIFITIVVVIGCFIDMIKRNGGVHGKEGVFVCLDFIAILSVGITGLIDVLRSYIIRVGDMGEYSRIGTAIFSVVLIALHIYKIACRYTDMMRKEVDNMKKQQELLLQANDRAQAANEAKGRFLANMSHEIRTPINTVLGMDEMILRESEEKNIREYARDIQSAGKTLLSIINDVLDFSKIESGKMEIIINEYDFSSLIHDVVNMTALRAEAKNLKFIVEIDKNIPSRLMGDDVRIRQVLVNILTNAIKYTSDGTVSIKVKGKTDGNTNTVRLHFEIEDTGIGIKQEDLQKLFKEFERIEEERNRNIEGTGLGMNITASLLRLMGSKLNVESIYGEGSTFFFDLEQEIVDSEPIGDFKERVKSYENDYSYKTSFVAPDAAILVVDDNKINRKVFVSLLKKTRIRITEAAGGEECLACVRENRYDMIFLDHMMPDMDGVETFRRMKDMEDNQCKDTPVIALTANAIAGAKEKYMEEGFHGYISKPISPDKLENIIRQFLPSSLYSVDIPEYMDEPEEEEKTLAQEMHEISQELEKLPTIEGVDLEYACYHMQDIDILKETIQEFYLMVDSEADTLEEMYNHLSDEGNLELYRIKVHAMKSTAALIGAMSLSGVAKVLEYAARDEHTDIIRALTPPFLEEWRTYKGRLKSFVEGENAEKEKADYLTDADTIKDLLVKLDDALNGMDIDTADEIMEKLRGYRYSEELEKDMATLSGIVSNIEIDRISDTVKNIIKKI